jgi:hypothetical protein
VYVLCATFYLIFGSGVRQPWDNPYADVIHYNSTNQNDEKEANRMIPNKNGRN